MSCHAAPDDSEEAKSFHSWSWKFRTFLIRKSELRWDQGKPRRDQGLITPNNPTAWTSHHTDWIAPAHGPRWRGLEAGLSAAGGGGGGIGTGGDEVVDTCIG